MSGANHYRSNLRDIFFNLFEALDTGRTTLGRAPFAALDERTARQVLEEYERFVVEKMAPSFAEADRVGCRLDGGRVILPEALKRSLHAYYEAEWHRLDLPEHLGGVGAPPTIRWSAFELLAGANASATYYLSSPFIATTIDRLGTESQKRRFVGNIADRHWGGAMVLTEPEAGSDVGQIRSRARHVAEDVWEIDGVKRFITNGDFDAADNVVHLLLARPEGHGAGTKGLSMFIVPKIWVEQDGSLGEANGVVCTSVEKKLGIKASATCEMTYGDRRPTRGFLVGGVHDGIRQMFMVIEHTRMAVGVKSMSTLSTAYLNALSYARHRVQGADLLRSADKAAPRIRIIGHPDVRRMLMAQKAHAEGMRALCLYAAHVQDEVEILGGHGAREAEDLDRLNDLLLPLVKGYCSERTWDLLALSLQCFGGSGYCEDFPIEQYIRDQKIDTLYEGTTHMQALDLFFRKIGRDGGQTLSRLLDRVRATIEAREGGALLAREREALARALADVEGILDAMRAKAGESLYHVGLWGNRILFALAEAVIGWLLIHHAAVAAAKVEAAPESDRPYYRGKIASARYFAREVLPGLGLARRLIEGSCLDILELEDAAF